MIHIPDGCNKIIHRLQENGHKAYVVGACVRDSLIGKEIDNWDICTSAKPDEIQKLFSESCTSSEKAGTVYISEDGEQYEVSTFRTNGTYSDSYNVVFAGTLMDDIAQRDLTINTLAYNDEVGMIDYMSGRHDIEHKILRSVGDAKKRMCKNSIEILSCLKLASVLGFSIEYKTKQAMNKNAVHLKKADPNQIRVELLELLNGEYCLDVLLQYAYIIAAIIPEIKPCIGFDLNNKHHCYSVYGHIAHAVCEYKGNDPVIKMALLLHDIGKPAHYSVDQNGGHTYGHAKTSKILAEKIVKALNFDPQSQHDIVELVALHDIEIPPTKRAIRRWMNRIGDRQFRRLLLIKRADASAHSPQSSTWLLERLGRVEKAFQEVLEADQVFSLSDLAINGYDLLQIGIPEGKEIGIILRHLLDSVAAGNVKNEKDYLLQEAQIQRRTL